MNPSDRHSQHSPREQDIQKICTGIQKAYKEQGIQNGRHRSTLAVTQQLYKQFYQFNHKL